MSQQENQKVSDSGKWWENIESVPLFVKFPNGVVLETCVFVGGAAFQYFEKSNKIKNGITLTGFVMYPGGEVYPLDGRIQPATSKEYLEYQRTTYAGSGFDRSKRPIERPDLMENFAPPQLSVADFMGFTDKGLRPAEEQTDKT